MDTNQQTKAAYLAQELNEGKWSPNILQNEVALRQCAADELLRLHAENENLQAGYDAARLEIESLQSRLIHANEQHRLWFARSQELESQLEAIGAGGVEPLRKREFLHSISDPSPSELDVRGCLAASLTCWHRLTGQEAAELVALFHGRAAQADALGALEEAASVLSSINKGASHEVTVGDEVCYWQRKEWIDWAEKEVLPKVRAAIDAARAAQGGV